MFCREMLLSNSAYTHLLLLDSHGKVAYGSLTLPEPTMERFQGVAAKEPIGNILTDEHVNI